MNRYLIVTVDTEEEGLWGGRYRRTGNTVENIRGVPRFQELCDGFGIQPTYLIDAPVVQDDHAVDVLREIHGDGRCEVGRHVHPWCNPPFEEDINESNTYLCNLPGSLQRRKIEWLTERIESRFGRRPISFRAGRYGLDATGAHILSDLGYTVDSSVIPFSDFSAQGGPDFRHAPYEPYFVAGNDLLQEHARGGLLEVPVTVGYSRVNFRRADAIRQLAAHSPLRQLRCVGILDRLGIARRIKLSPEQSNAAQMKRLVDVCSQQEAPCLTLMFHSFSPSPGHSPYVPDGRALELFFERLRQVFEYCLCDLNYVESTLADFATTLLPNPEPAPSIVASQSRAWEE